MTLMTANSCKLYGTTLRLRRSFLLYLAVLSAAVLLCGCSPQKKRPALSMTKGQLLLEIYDAVEKKQYDTALQKIARYRILDPASATMAEMEQTIRFNQLTAVVHFYLRQNNFRGALNAVQSYEKDHGISKRTMAAREQLLFFARLDQVMEEICSARNSQSLERALRELEKIRKEKKLSPKTMNFLRKKQSKLKRLRLYERDLVSETLCQESRFQAEQNSDLRTAEILFALVKALHEDHAGVQKLERYLQTERIYPD